MSGRISRTEARVTGREKYPVGIGIVRQSGMRLVLIAVLVVIASGCSALETVTPQIWLPSPTRETSIEFITGISEQQPGRVGLLDGRERTVEHMRVFRDTLSYVIVPGNRLEAVDVTQIRSIDISRTSRTRGIVRGATLGAALGAVIGPVLEFWAGNRGGPLVLSAPVYGGVWGALGAGIGAITGHRQTYSYRTQASGSAGSPIADE